MKKNIMSRKKRRDLVILGGLLLIMVQYQNCAQPVNQTGNNGDPSYIANPIAGSTNNAIVSANGPSSKMFFAESLVDLSSNSQILRPGGICSQAAGVDPVQWSLAEDQVNSMILAQGAENCNHGSFHVELTAQIANLACDKAYVLSASHSGEGSTQMSIVKHCAGIASNP